VACVDSTRVAEQGCFEGRRLSHGATSIPDARPGDPRT
jgi:hypothetical protein